MSVRRRRLWPLAVPAVLLALLAAAVLWAAFAPLAAGNRDALFEIPKGTWARRMAGDKVDILPDTIRLTLGVRDVLLLKNSDTVPQIFGPVLIMPGQEFRLPFETVSENQFACTAHTSGQMTIIVDPAPAAGWARLHWRTSRLFQNRT